MLVTLTRHELRIAHYIARCRHEAAQARHSADAHGYAGDSLRIHQQGAAGEVAAAKALGCYWPASVDTYKGADLEIGGVPVQVRTRSRPDYDLIIRDDDSDDAAFVLVIGTEAHYEVVGWIAGGDGKRPVWRRAYGGRAPAYFVPRGALRQLEELHMAEVAR